MKTNTFKFIIVATLLILISCEKKENTIVDKADVISVVVNKSSTSNTNNKIYGSGKVEASKTAILSTRIMGNITKIHVEIGDKISKNDILVSISNADLLAKKAQINTQISTAEKAFNNAKQDFNRYTSLLATESISKKEMENISLQFQIAKNKLKASNEMSKEINAQLDYTNIKAPFDGIITQKLTKEGNIANPGMPIIAMENSKKLQINTLVAETDIHKISESSNVNVHIESLNKNFKGKIIAISNSSKNTGGQFLTKVELINTSNEILTGMYANVEIETNQNKSETLWIPKSAIVTRGQLSGVYTVSSSNTAILRWLRLGKTHNNNIEVLSGLDKTEKYILNSEGKLFNGAAVSVQ